MSSQSSFNKHFFCPTSGCDNRCRRDCGGFRGLVNRFFNHLPFDSCPFDLVNPITDGFNPPGPTSDLFDYGVLGDDGHKCDKCGRDFYGFYHKC
ncbi:unnamed protein product, partial [Rotaria magnacalcarata]